jgi:predicted transcriptional regulator
MSDKSFSFERKEEESDKAWNAFNIFLDTKPPNRLQKVADRLHITRQAVSKWAKKYDWDGRVASYEEAITNAVTRAVIEQEIDVRTQMMKNLQLLLKAQEKEIMIRLTEQDRKIANPDYDYRPSSIRTISETGKLAMEHLTLLEPPEQMKDDDTGDLFKLVKDCKEIDASSGR